MKVKLFAKDTHDELETAINDFISKNTIEVKDIKYQLDHCGSFVCFSALVVYADISK